MPSFNTTTGPKQAIRNMICQAAKKENINPKRIFTLPAKDMLCVKTFQKNFPKANITGVEYDKQVFDIIANKAPLGLTIENMSIGQFAKKENPGQHFDIAFLDYFSWLNRTTKQEVLDFVSNQNIVHPGKTTLLALTFQKANRQGTEHTQELIKEVKARYSRDWENNKDNICLVIQDALRNYQPKVIAKQEYTNEGGVPMYFFLLKIVG